MSVMSAPRLLKQLVAVMDDESQPASCRLAAAKAVLERRYGKVLHREVVAK